MPIAVNGLGTGGVNVDSDPLDLQDNELTNSQNATLGTLKNRAKALIKRRGLEKINQGTLGAAILGGIEAPYQGTAQAPANGSGGGLIDTGDPNLGTGVAPGGSSTVAGQPGSGGSAGNTNTNTASSIFSQTPLFGGGRVVILAKDATGSTAQGFIVMPSGWGSTGVTKLADGVTLPTTIPPDIDTPQFGVSFSAARTWKNFAVANGSFYYARGGFGLTSAASPVLPAIIKMSADGKVVAPIMTVPDNPQILALSSPAPNHRTHVTALCTEYGNGDALWIATWDQITSGGSAGHYGRVLRLSGLDSGAYAITEVYNALNTNSNSAYNGTPTIPFAIEPFLGNMWMGVIRGTATGTAPGFTMFQPSPTSPDGWDVKKGTTFGSTAADVTCMKAFNGLLFVGVVDRDPTVSNAALYSVDAIGTNTAVLTGSAGTATSPVGWISLEVFNGKLYASYANSNVGAKIYSSPDGTTWSAVFTASTAAEKASAYILWADGTNTLYAFAGTPVSTTKSCYKTTDGITWTDETANFPGTPSNAIFAFDQS